MVLDEQKRLLPEYPSTPHLPHKPNTDRMDRVATPEEAAVIFSRPVRVEAKLDGASCGMSIWQDGPAIRNRNHVLRKGYHKPTSAAKMQFASVWNWWYDHRKWFKSLVQSGPYSVFGEWLWARHGIHYDRLPDSFVAYDVFDYKERYWVSPAVAIPLLNGIGFATPPLHFDGVLESGSYEQLEAWANAPSAWGVGKEEGVYVKVYDDRAVTHRFKMVREDFVRGEFWDEHKLKLNELAVD